MTEENTTINELDRVQEMLRSRVEMNDAMKRQENRLVWEWRLLVLEYLRLPDKEAEDQKDQLYHRSNRLMRGVKALFDD